MEHTPTDPARTQTPNPAANEEDTSLAENEHPAAPEADAASPAEEPPPPRILRRKQARKRPNILRVEQEMGALEMSNTIVATIVRREIPGEEVVEIRGKGLRKKLRSLLARSRVVDGVCIEQRDGALTIEITIAVRYGIDIPAVANEIRDRLAGKIEHMTGCKVEAVNIIVDRIVARE